LPALLRLLKHGKRRFLRAAMSAANIAAARDDWQSARIVRGFAPEWMPQCRLATENQRV
jgi:hypothetical protein